MAATDVGQFGRVILHGEDSEVANGGCGPSELWEFVASQGLSPIHRDKYMIVKLFTFLVFTMNLATLDLANVHN